MGPNHPQATLDQLRSQNEAVNVKPVPADETYREGLKALRNQPFLKSPKWREQQQRANRRGANVDIIIFEQALINRLAKLGVPMFGHTVIRDAAAQNKAFAEGNSKARAGRSPHNYGCAVDIVHSVKAWDLTKTEWEIIGHVGKEVAASRGIKVRWGGDFQSLYDPAHWEIMGWKTLPHAAFGMD